MTVVANTGDEDAELPVAARGAALLASGPFDGRVLPSDTTVWFTTA